MAQYDGSIRILTKISTEMAEKSLGTLSQTIKGTAKEITSLRSKMDAMKNESIPTGDYKTLQSELEKSKKKLSELVTKQNEWEKLGVTSGGAWDTLNEEIAKASDKVDAIKEKMYQLEEAGQAFNMGEETQEYANLERQLQYEEEALRKAQELQKVAQSTGDPYARLSASLSELNSALSKVLHPINTMKSSFLSAAENMKARAAGVAATIINGIAHPFQSMKEIASSSISKTAKILSNLASAAKKVGSAIAKAASSMSLFGKNTKKSNNMLQSGFKNILKYGLGIRSFYVLINKFRNAVKEGFGNLAQYSDPVNKSLSSLKSALLQLKNSFATAFAPILTTIAPALTAFINLVSKAVTAVGMLIAALTGQKTFDKAVAVQEDYAESLSGTAKSAKDANKQLSSLDNLNNLTTNDSGGGGGGAGGGTSPGDMFETVEIPSAISDLAEKMKEIWSGIWDVFKQAWESKGKSVIEAVKTALGSLKEAATSVGTTFYNVFTQGTGLTWIESSLELLRSILGVIHSIASAFTEAWNSGAGIENVTALFNMFTNINGLLTSIGDSFSRVFSDGIGVEIWNNILGIITGVFNIIGNLAESIQKAWNTAGIGDGIWSGILGVANTILETIHNIVDSTAEWAGELDFTPLLQSIDTLLQTLQPLTENIGTGLELFWNNVLLPIASWTIQEAVPVFLDMVSAAIGALNLILSAFQPLGIWLWENFLLPIGEWAGDTVISAMQTISEILTIIGNWVSEHAEAITALLATIATAAGIFLLVANAGTILSTAVGLLGAAFGLLTSPVGIIVAAIAALSAGFIYLYENCEEFAEFINGTLSGIFNDILSPALSYLGEELLPILVSTFKNLWTNVLVPLGEFIGSVLSPVFGVLSSLLSALWNNIIVPLAEVIRTVFSKALSGLGKIINQTIIPCIKLWITVFQFLWNKVLSPIVSYMQSTLSPVFSSIFKTVKSVINGMKKIFGGLIDFITGVFTGNWKTAWDGITGIIEGVKDVFKGVINGILGCIESMANGVIKGINVVINALNKLHFDIPDWVPALGGKSFGFDIPELKSISIPKLATGAVIPANKEFLAVLGDQKHGTNIEAPLDTIKQAVREELGSLTSQSSGGNIELHLTVECEGYKLLQLIQKLDREQFAKTQRPSFQM